MVLISEAAEIKPSNRQIRWQELEFYGFIHFGMNTLTGDEWGAGNEDLNMFNPKKLNVYSWVKILKEAGMQGVLLTVKHHDGFCLWPSNYTNYSVKNTPWKNGEGDIVKEISNACQKYNLKFGIYLSPWDRTEKTYGSGSAYDEYFVNQLKELSQNYGEIFCFWFDGANGEGPNGKIQNYDWDRYYSVIRRFQPQAVISIMGPDVRWVGNEAGSTRVDEWSVVPDYLADKDYTANNSQKVDDGNFSKMINRSSEDLGSRQLIESYPGKLIWYPAEVDVSIRPGWIYHKNEDNKVKNGGELFKIYKNSVGNNCTLLLNIPPNKDGLIHANDIEALKNLKTQIDKLYRKNFIEEGIIKFSSKSPDSNSSQITSKKLGDYYWEPSSEDPFPTITVEFYEPKTLNTVIIGEFIPKGQLIEQLEVQYFKENCWKNVVSVSSIGYRKIIEFNSVESTKFRITIPKSRKKPKLNYISFTCT